MICDALPEVLAVFVRGDPAWWRDVLADPRRVGGLVWGTVGVEVRIDRGHPMGAATDLRRWRVSPFRPCDATEALVARDMLPPHWLDPERAPGWWCPDCDGTNIVWSDEDAVAWTCCGGFREGPSSLANLAAVASLGRSGVDRVESVVAETWPGSAIVWRTLALDRLARSAATVRWRRDDSAPENEPCTPAHATAVQAWLENHRRIALVPENWSMPWPEECPYVAPAVRRAWRALLALHEVGAHLVADIDDPERVGALAVLGVDPLP